MNTPHATGNGGTTYYIRNGEWYVKGKDGKLIKIKDKPKK